MSEPTSEVWEVMSTARTIRRFTDEPVDDATLARCLEAATWAPSGANAQAWRFVVLRSRELTSVLFTQQRFTSASELLLGASIFPAMQNFLLAARAQGLGACLTSWASYGGEPHRPSLSVATRVGQPGLGQPGWSWARMRSRVVRMSLRLRFPRAQPSNAQ